MIRATAVGGAQRDTPAPPVRFAGRLRACGAAMRRHRVTGPGLGAGIVLALGLGGCFARPTESVLVSPAQPSGEPRVMEEHRDEVELSASVLNATLDVVASQHTFCQSVTVTPMIQAVETRQSAPKSAQIGNAIGAILFVGGGAAFIPSASQLPLQVGIGIGFIALGGVFAAALISNVARAHELHDTMPSAPQKLASGFRSCNLSPLVGIRLIATIGHSNLYATTDSTGHALFDLAAVDPTQELVQAGLGHVHQDHYGTKPLDVDLSSSSVFPKWRASVEARPR